MRRARYNTRPRQLMEQIEQTWPHAPSLAELAAWMDAPINSAWYALRALERDGRVVVRNRGCNRLDGSALTIVPNRVRS